MSRVLLTGATGFIGSAILAGLEAERHDVVAVARPGGSDARGLRAQQWIALDMARSTDPDDWSPHLAGIDAVVNCAGVLQDSPRDSTTAVHAAGPAALFKACERAGVRRVIQISAIGIDKDAPTSFSRSKRVGDELLAALDLDWVVLRPSVVVGRGAYGGSALFRGLASLPLLPLPAKTGPLQIVQLDDLVGTVLFFLRPDAPSRKILEVAGPERLSLAEVVASYRRWLGWSPARVIRMPRLLESTLYLAGDALALLGWRPPVRSTVGRELTRGGVGDTAEWRHITGFDPMSLTAALAAEPASVQERWFARLYVLKPLILIAFALFWILTGVISLGPGHEIGAALLKEGGLGRFAGVGVWAGASADIVIGIGIAFARTARIGLFAALALSVFYVAMGTMLLPRLWADPIGPMLKIWPVMALNLVALAVLKDR